MKRQAQLLYIAGTGRCGSTLLDVLLGTHPEITGVGEFFAFNEHPDTRDCSCGNPVNHCHYWSEFREFLITKHPELESVKLWDDYHVGELPHTQSDRKLPSLAEVALLLGSPTLLRILSCFSEEIRMGIRNAEQCWTLFDALVEFNDTNWIVDSSKHAKRMKWLYLTRPDSVKIIHLIRDGRSLLARHKLTGESVEHAAILWKNQTRNIIWMLKSVAQYRRKRVFYKDLCAMPQYYLNEIEEWLQIGSFDINEKKAIESCHQIPGNRLIYRPISQIKLNLEWMNVLDLEDFNVFEKHAGELSRSLGYPSAKEVISHLKNNSQ